MEVESSSRNKDGLLDEQSTTTGSTVYGSCDDYDSDEEQCEDQPLSLQEHKDDLEIPAETSDIHRMIKEHSHVHAEDVRFLEKVPGMEEKTSHLSFQMVDNLEDKSSASEDELIEEHAFQHEQDNKEPNNVTEDDPALSADVQPRDDMREFTEDDHVRVEEGLADYPSDLSQSEDEDCGEIQEDEPSHMNTELDEMHLQADEEHGFYQMNNQAITSTDEDSTGQNKSMNPAFKNDLEDACEEYNSYADADSENFQSIALLDENSEGHTNEKPDYDSDISSDEDEHSLGNNVASHEQEKTFAEDVVESEEDMEGTDSQHVEICDVGGLSDVPAFPEAGMDSRMEGSSAYVSDNSNSGVSYLQSNLIKPDNTEHDTDGESVNTLLPETFWRLVDEDSLKLDEYDWDVKGQEVICDEEEDFLEEPENEEMERDWEKERERIEAFNRYYKSFEDEENVCKCLEIIVDLET